MHWADVEAEKLGEGSLVATGEAPSGSIHLGHIRELLTGEAIARASEGDLILIVDSFDPLRKLYPFLDKSYKDHIGKPLSEVPCPCGKHDDYAEHFMEPFLESLEKLGADLEVVYAHEMYAKGDYEEATRKVIEKKEAIADIIEENTGRQLSDDWFPYNPKCSECEKIGKTTITGFEDPFVLYECDCGNEGKADIRSDDGKLPWRCDWPARWWILGIDCEPFGKDHAASGGSWDTGKEIIKEVFDREPPVPVIYEWIQLKGEGPMSSSSGVSIRTEDMLNMVAPEVLRFFIMRSRPNTHIDIEPGLAILDLVDEYDQNEEQYFEGEDDDLKRVYELSQVDKVPDEKPERIPYRHLVNLVQIYDDYEAIWKVAKDTGQITRGSERDFELMKERAERVEYWLENYAPDFVKFSIKESLPDVDLSEEEKQFLESYKDSTEGKDWNPEILHQLVHQNAEKIGLSKGKAFRSFYKILLGKSKGPRLGRFLSQLEREFVKERILEAVKN
ncbi:MAG: lysine--tRNA ligase [Candidatus Saliniplasma sp.]